MPDMSAMMSIHILPVKVLLYFVDFFMCLSCVLLNVPWAQSGLNHWPDVTYGVRLSVVHFKVHG